LLVYLGFLNAEVMPRPFCTVGEWRNAMRRYSAGRIHERAWGSTMTINGTPFLPLIRAVEVLFEPSTA
jgi:hypothetical protein